MHERVILTIGAVTYLALGGCAVHRPVPAPIAAEEVSYRIEWVEGRPPAVRITLCVHGEADGTSRLAISSQWGGVENCERFVHGLTVCDSAGRACRVATDSVAPHGWNVAHEPHATLTAIYELQPAVPDALADFRTHYEPVIRDDLLHLIGHTGLIFPEWLEDRGPIDIRLEWVGFDKPGWTVASSFDHEEGRVRCSLPEFREAMFFAGRVRAIDRNLRGGRLRVAIYGNDWEFKDGELADLVERIIAVEREFMHDFSDPYFLVTVVPTGPRATPQSFSLGGTGLADCFALFLPPGTAVDRSSPRREQVLILLAHEYFHTWNGQKLSMEEPEELVYWFSEGFTDFYASRLLRRGGLIDDAAWAGRLNETLKRLWLSPVATEPAATIQRDFWNRPEVQRLPYQRGEVVALALDEEIRQTSGGKRSLDDFMRELLTDAGKVEKAETDRLLGRIAKWTSASFAESLRRIVLDGALPDPPARITEPAAVRATIDAHGYEPGFDLDATFKSKIATGVREGSAAHAAGLRDGQRVVGFDVARGEPDREIKLKIRGEGQPRTIKFFPRGELVGVPQYRLVMPGGG